MIISGIFSLGFIVGQTSFLKSQIKKQNECIQKVLNSDSDLNTFFGHKIEFHTIWTHAEAAVALKYQKCIWSE